MHLLPLDWTTLSPHSYHCELAAWTQPLPLCRSSYSINTTSCSLPKTAGNHSLTHSLNHTFTLIIFPVWLENWYFCGEYLGEDLDLWLLTLTTREMLIFTLYRMLHEFNFLKCHLLSQLLRADDVGLQSKQRATQWKMLLINRTAKGQEDTFSSELTRRGGCALTHWELLKPVIPKITQVTDEMFNSSG